MTRTLLAAALGLLPLVAPAAQQMRPDARPVGGTLRPTATGPAATLALTLRATAETGIDSCPGYVGPSAPDAVVEWPGGDLRLTTIGDGFDPVLAVSGPDGQWHCNDDGTSLTPIVDIRRAARGRYAVWVGAWQQDAGQQAITLSAATLPPPPVFSLNGRAPGGTTRVAAGFEAQNGPLTLTAQAGGTDSVTETEITSAMSDTEYCSGYVDMRTPSAVVEYSGGGTLAFAATLAPDVEMADLTMAVHTPGGAWRCSDDFNGLDPAIGIEQAAAGRYDVWIGTYGADGGRVGAVLTLTEAMPVAPEYPDDPGMGSMPFSEGTYMPLDLATRPSVRLRVGDQPVSGTAAVAPAGANPVSGMTCYGFIAAAPTASVEMSGAGPLGITATAEDGTDLTLVVRTPDNRWFCSDDADGLNPGVQIGTTDDPTAASGTYLVWVGTYGDPTGMSMDGMDMDAQPMGPTAVTVTALRGEIVVSTPDFGMGDMMDDRPDFSAGTYDGQDLQPDRPVTTLSLRDNAAEADVTVNAALINPVDGDACVGFIDPRPTFAFTAGDMPASITAASDDADLVMLVRAPSGGWFCSDDAQGSSSPRVDTAEAGRYGVWVGTYSRPAGPVSAHVSVGMASGM